MKNDWTHRRLGDVVTRLTNGFVGPTRDIYLESGVPYLLARHVKNNCLQFDGKTFISDAFNQKNAKSLLRAGDVLLVQSGHIGHSAVVTEEHEGHNCHAMIVISPAKEVLNGNFLSWFFASPNMQQKFEEIRSGSTVPHLTCGAVKDLQFALPPLPEQNRIAGILNEAFEGIATAKANAEKNLQNARAIFESHLQSVFTQRGLGWRRRPLGQIAEVQSGGTPSISQQQYWGGDIPWYSSGELNSTYTTHSERQITDAGLSNSNAKLFPKGSLLVGMYDTAALKMSILDREGTFNQAIAGVKPNDKLLNQFVLHAINANKTTLLLERRGVRQKNLSLGKIKEIKVPLPDLTEQHKVVTHLSSVMDETRRLESLYQQKLASLEALKKSLLHQAFTRQL
jgi:type I restriction enzyme S subunit